MDAAGMDTTEAAVKLKAAQARQADFLDKTGLKRQSVREQRNEFRFDMAKRASAEYKMIAISANAMYNTGSEDENVAAFLRDKPIRDKIRSDPSKLVINVEKQSRHILGSGYIPGRSYFTVSIEQLQEIVNQYAGTGLIVRDSHGVFKSKEMIEVAENIGMNVDPSNGNKQSMYSL